MLKKHKGQVKNSNTIVVSMMTKASKAHPALCESFAYCLKKATFKMGAQVELMLQGSGIVPPQIGILTLLELGGPLNQNNLGDEMGIDKASMVKWIDGLERKKLVKRDVSRDDRRVKHVSITPKGIEFRKKTMAKMREVEKEFLSDLTDKEAEALKAILQKLIK